MTSSTLPCCWLGRKSPTQTNKNFEPSQSLGGVKTGDPWEKNTDQPQAELGLSHTWPELGWNPQRWDDKRFRAAGIRFYTVCIKYMSNCKNNKINSFLPSIPFFGYRQTVQTQIRRLRTRHLIRVFTVCWQEFLFEIEKKWKSTPDTHKFGNRLVQLIRMDKSTRQIWVE